MVLLGLSLRGFEAVIAAAGGRAALEGVTTGELKHKFVLPATSATRSSYYDLLRSKASGADEAALLAGAATVFLSHAYDYVFLDAVDAAAAWEKALAPQQLPRPMDDEKGAPSDGGSITKTAAAPSSSVTTPPPAHYYYFDLLVVNQHGQGDAVVPFETLRDEFGGSVRAVGHTLFLLDYAQPVSLGRAWCVFEAATSLASGARFEVIMAPRSAASFARALEGDFEGLLVKVCEVDVERARAREAVDEANIKRAIEADEGGFLAVNRLVISAMRKWMLEAGQAALTAQPAAIRPLSLLQLALARLLMMEGRLDDAESLYAAALAARRALQRGDGGAPAPPPRNAENMFIVMDALAGLLEAKGDLDSSEAMYREALAGMRDLAGGHAFNSSGFILCGNFSGLLLKRGARTEAEALLREAVSGLREIRGDRDHGMLLFTAHLSGILESQGRFGEAVDLCREAYEGLRIVRGDSHPDTHDVLTKLTGQMLQKGDVAGALPLLRKSVAFKRRAFGDTHEYTLKGLNTLAVALRTRNFLDAEATALFRQVYAGWCANLGILHLSSLSAASSLAVCLAQQGDPGGAKALLREAHAGLLETVGPTHRLTLMVSANLGCLERDTGAKEEAAALFREVLASLRAADFAGDGDPQTWLAARNLVGVLRCLKREEEAASAVRSLLASTRPMSGEGRAKLLLLLTRCLEKGSSEALEAVAAAAVHADSSLRHSHQLQKRDGAFAANRNCDLCGRAGSSELVECFSCDLCGFDVCNVCVTLARPLERAADATPV